MRHKKIRAYYFLFLWLLRCFSSPAYLLMSYVFRHGYLDLQSRWVSPFGYSRVKGCLGPHRDLSHPATSFIDQIMSRHPPCTLSAHYENTKLCFFFVTYNLLILFVFNCNDLSDSSSQIIRILPSQL